MTHQEGAEQGGSEEEFKMQEVCEIIRDTDRLAKEGKLEQALEIFLDAIDAYQPINGEVADEVAFQMGCFLFGQHFYVESMETWKKLQSKGFRQGDISQIVEEAFLASNEKEFRLIYEENLEKYKGQIHTGKSYDYGNLPICFLPVADGCYFLYDKNNGLIGEKISTVKLEISEDEIFNGENIFDTIVFWKDWDYEEPIKGKQRNRKQLACFLSEGAEPFSYLQLPEFEELFQDGWQIFDSLDAMKLFFHEHGGLFLPRLYKGIQGDAELFREWIEEEHHYRCSKEGRNKQNILLTVGIPSFNRGHRAFENIKHLRKLPYDSEVEFLVCDNCSVANTEGYQEIERLAETDSRITYYRFPDKPGGNISFAEAVNLASGKFCCMLSDEDLLCLENVWKYLYLFQKYGNNLGFVKAAGEFYYHDNDNKYLKKGKEAFEEVFWSLNYLSGCIFSTEAHRRLKLHELYGWHVGNIGNSNPFAKAYPHNAAAMRCALEENVYTCKEVLFCEGKDEFVEAHANSGKKVMIGFARLDNRLWQLSGIVAFLNEWKEMLTQELIMQSYMRAVSKVFMLVDLIRRQGRIVECSFRDAYNCILRASIEKSKELEIDINDRDYAYMILLFSCLHQEYYKEGMEES